MCAILHLDMQTIDRAFTVLRALAAENGTSTLADVSRASGLPRSTVLRLLGALEEQGMTQSIGGRWALGPGLTTLTHQTSPVSALKELARPHLLELADLIGENASLVIADGDGALYIDTAVAKSVVSVQNWTGERLPFHSSAAGLCLMSKWTDHQLRRYAAAGMTQFTRATVATLPDLRRRMIHIRDNGVVWTLREFSDDVNGVGAPIIGPDGEAIGAINVYGPDYRFPGPRPLDEITDPLIEACARISARLA